MYFFATGKQILQQIVVIISWLNSCVIDTHLFMKIHKFALLWIIYVQMHNNKVLPVIIALLQKRRRTTEDIFLIILKFSESLIIINYTYRKNHNYKKVSLVVHLQFCIFTLHTILFYFTYHFALMVFFRSYIAKVRRKYRFMCIIVDILCIWTHEIISNENRRRNVRFTEEPNDSVSCESLSVFSLHNVLVNWWLFLDSKVHEGLQVNALYTSASGHVPDAVGRPCRIWLRFYVVLIRIYLLFFHSNWWGNPWQGSHGHV